MPETHQKEKRWSARRATVLTVDVHYQGKQYIGCRTRDIGLGGMFIEFQPSGLAPGRDIHIALKIDRAGNSERRRFKARVAHSSDSGFGLAFETFDRDDFHILQDLLHPT